MLQHAKEVESNPTIFRLLKKQQIIPTSLMWKIRITDALFLTTKCPIFTKYEYYIYNV